MITPIFLPIGGGGPDLKWWQILLTILFTLFILWFGYILFSWISPIPGEKGTLLEIIKSHIEHLKELRIY